MTVNIHIERPDLFEGAEALRRSLSEEKVATLVRGTTHGEWADPGSPFRRYVLDPAGVTVAANIDYEGDPLPLWRPRDDWEREGGRLARAMLRMLPWHRNLITHSHGFQVGMKAATSVHVHTHIAIAGPVRPDMNDIYAAGAQNTRRLVYVRDTGRDRTATWGQWFGNWRLWFWFRKGRLPSSAEIEEIEGMGHSRILYEWFEPWGDRRLLSSLTV